MHILALALPLAIVPLLAAAELPDPFLFADGRRVKSPHDWPARRTEITELILRNEYGHLPPPPKSTTILPLVSNRMKPFDALHRQFKLTFDPGERREKISIIVDLLLPPGNGPFPVILT